MMKRRVFYKLLAILLMVSMMLSATGVLSLMTLAVYDNGQVSGSSSSAETNVTDEQKKEGNDTTDSLSSANTEENKASESSTDKSQTDEEKETQAAQSKEPDVVTESTEISTQSFTGSGAGTSANPYQVANAQQFREMQDVINDTGNANKYFILTADIDLSSIVFSDFIDYNGFYGVLVSLNHTSASISSNVFIHLDGAKNDGSGTNYKITGLDISNASKSSMAIFGYLSANSVIQNIDFQNCTLNVSYSSAVVSAIVAVQNDGTIQDCNFTNMTLNMAGANSSVTTVSSTFNSKTIYNGNAIVTADNNGTVSGLNFTNTQISVKGRRNFVGVVAGQNRGTISDVSIDGIKISCWGSLDDVATPPIVGQGDVASYVGAIAGRNYGASSMISNSSVLLTGTTTLTQNLSFGDYVGGIVGANAGTVTLSSVTGTIDNTSNATGTIYNIKGIARMGGIAGSNTGTISSVSAIKVGAYYSGSGENSNYGGIVGYNTGSVTGAFSTGVISDNGTGTTTLSFGGVVGYASTGTTLSNCYTLVAVSKTPNYAGAVVGRGGGANLVATCYWSSVVSGHFYPYSRGSFLANDIYRSLTVINLQAGSAKAVAKTSMAHTWGSSTVAVDNVTAFTSTNVQASITNTASNFSLNCASAGQYGYVKYNVNITLPAGVGVSQSAISQQLKIPFITTASAANNAGMTASNPIILSNAAEAAFMAYAPYAHFKLGTSFSISSWTPFSFCGTLNGDGKTLTVSSTGGLFTAVYGGRNSVNYSSANAGDWKTLASNLQYGYIHDFTVAVNATVTDCMFGDINGATASNISVINAGSGAFSFNTSNSGGMFNNVEGNCYLNECYTEVDVAVSSSTGEGFGTIIGAVAANVLVIEKCGSTADINLSANLSKVGSIVGTVNSVSTYISVSNSFASGRVRVTSAGGLAVNSKVVIGYISAALVGSANFVSSNNFWSIAEKSDEITLPATYSVSETAMNLDVDGYASLNFDLWSFANSQYTASTTSSEVSIAIPSGIDAFNGATASDFSVNVVLTASCEADSISVSGGNVKFNVRALNLGETFSTVLTVTHIPTGMKARTIIRSGLSLVDGYYEIYEPADLQTIAANFESTYNTANFKLCSDIDMTGISISPIGSSSYPFSGEFIGKLNENGIPYTISNLSVTDGTNSALFGYANGPKFANLRFDNFTSDVGTNYGAVLAGYVVNTSATKGLTVDNIIIENSVVKGYGTTSKSYLGAIVGYMMTASGQVLETDEDINVITNVTVKNSSIGNEYASRIGGLVGYIKHCSLRIGNYVDTAVSEENAGIILEDVSVAGKEYIGGVLGMVNNTFSSSASTSSDGYFTINGVNFRATGTEGNCASECIASTSYAGGIYASGQNNPTVTKIQNCYLTGVLVSNSGTTVTSTASTGGIAAVYCGYIDDCIVRNCTIKGISAGGAVGRTFIISEGRDLYVSGVKIYGTTSIGPIDGYTAAAASVAGGILSGQARASSTTEISDCEIGKDVEIGGVADNGGIVGNCTSASSALIKITGCSMYGTVSSAGTLATEYAGGIMGRTIARVAFTEIGECFVAGSVVSSGTSKAYAGGVLGWFNYGSSETATETPLVHDCYVSATLSGNNKGKILGGNSGSNLTSGCFNNATAVNNAFKDNVISTYPDDVGAFVSDTKPSLNGGDSTYIDVNRPGGTNNVVGLSGDLVLDGGYEASIYVYNGTDYVSAASFTAGQNTVILFDLRALTSNISQSTIYSPALAPTATDVTVESDNKILAANVTNDMLWTPTIGAGGWELTSVATSTKLIASAIDTLSLSATAGVVSYNSRLYVSGLPLFYNTTEAAIYAVSGSTVTATVSNTATTVIEYPGYVGANHKFIFDTTTDASTGTVGGWSSLSTAIAEVTQTTDPQMGVSGTVTVKGKINGTTALVGKYLSSSFLIPETNQPAYLEVSINVSCQNMSAFSLSGSGTVSDPYQIWTKNDLNSVRDARNFSAYFILMDNITFSAADFDNTGGFYNNGNFFTPIGYSNINNVVSVRDFAGHFNGNNKTISGIKFNSDASNIYCALFSKTNGAVISNLTLSAVNSIGNEVSETPTTFVAAVSAYAVNTTFTNVDISSVTISGSNKNSSPFSYAGSLAAYAIDCTVSGCDINSVEITKASYVGGLFGHAHATASITSNSITDSSVTGINVTSIQTTAPTNYDVAGGIVGEFSGTITNADVRGTGNIISARNVASGIVASLAEVKTDGDLSTIFYAISISDASVTGAEITSSYTAQPYASAGGILASVHNNSNSAMNDLTSSITISNSTTSSSVSVSAGYYAGGIFAVTKAPSTTLFISGCTSNATVRSTYDSTALPTPAAAIAAYFINPNITEISQCFAGGTITADGSMGKAAGFVGYVAATAAYPATNSTVSLVHDSVFNAYTYATLGTGATGVALGGYATANATFPTTAASYSVVPFRNIYYSNYNRTSSAELAIPAFTGVPEMNASQGIRFDATFCNLNALTYGTSLDQQIFLTGPIALNDSPSTTINLPVVSSGTITGDFEQFSAPNSVIFTLDSVTSVSAGEEPLFTYNPTTRVVTPASDEGACDVVFTYTNGIQIAISALSYDIDTWVDTEGVFGEADESYFLITQLGHFEVVRRLSDRKFIQAANIDFSTGLTPFAPIAGFSGGLIGQFYPSNGSGGYDENAALVQYELQNVNIDNSAGAYAVVTNDTNVYYTGLFSSLNNASVNYLKFVDSTVTGFSSNGATVQTASYTGMLAGAVLGSSAISHIYIDIDSDALDGITRSTVTGGTDVGGIIGRTSNTSIVSDCAVNNTDVLGYWSINSTNGSRNNVYVGGIVGEASSSVAIVNCSVEDSTVKSRASAYDSIYAGGIAGVAIEVNDSSVSGCTIDTITANIITSSEPMAGGIAAICGDVNDCSVDSCTVSSATTHNGNLTTGAVFAGGIVAKNQTSVQTTLTDTNGNQSLFYKQDITGCTVTGVDSPTVITGNKLSGGILGYSANTAALYLTDCIVGTPYTASSDTIGDVMVTATETLENYGAMGGIIGQINYAVRIIEVTNCQSYASVESSTSRYAGGIVGVWGVPREGNTQGQGNAAWLQAAKFNNCVASGSLSSAWASGGLVANVTWNVSTQYSGIYLRSGFAENCVFSAYYKNSSDSKKEGLIFGNCYDTALINPSSATDTFENVFSGNYWSSYVSDKDGLYNFSATSQLNPSVAQLMDVTLVNNNPDELSFSIDNADGKGYVDYAIAAYTPDGTNTFSRNTKVNFVDSMDESKNIAVDGANSISLNYPGKAIDVVGYAVELDDTLSPCYSVNTIDSDTIAITANRSLSGSPKLVAKLGYGLKVDMYITEGSKSVNVVTLADLININNSASSSPYANNYTQTADIIIPDSAYTLGGALYHEVDIDRDGTIEAGEIFTGFVPIGNSYSSSAYFKGSYNGDGHVIKNLKIANLRYDSNGGLVVVNNDLGMFGHVQDTSAYTPQLRNIHIELADGGLASTGNNIGGLVGTYKASNDIVNCSVIGGSVLGGDAVGGLVGHFEGRASLESCFTSTDVKATHYTTVAPLYHAAAGGLVGKAIGVEAYGVGSSTKIEMNSCFSSSMVVSSGRYGSGMIGWVESNGANDFTYVLATNCYFTGGIRCEYADNNGIPSQPSCFVGFQGNSSSEFIAPNGQASYLEVTNTYVGGFNASYYQYFLTGFGYTAYILPYSQNQEVNTSSDFYYDSTVLGEINKLSYYLQNASTVISNATGVSTESMTDGTSLFGDTAGWSYANGSYPYLTLSTNYLALMEGVATQPDTYTQAYSKLCAVPFGITRESEIVEEEVGDDVIERVIVNDGLLGMTYVPSCVAADEETEINIESSAISATGTNDYGEGGAYATYDTLLYGNTVGGVQNKDTDLLFHDYTDESKIGIVRNMLLEGTGLTAEESKTPYVKISATIGGKEAARKIYIPLEDTADTYYVATERQLNAVGSSAQAMNNKFGVYRSTTIGTANTCLNNTGAKVQVIGDIFINPVNTFDPIANFKGDFDGNDFTISNLTISKNTDEVGLFSVLSGTSSKTITISDLKIENPRIDGNNYIGALVGKISEYVIINGCSVMSSESASGTNYHVNGVENVGGLIGGITASNASIGYTQTGTTDVQYYEDQYSGANIYVSGSNNVGGFIGSANSVNIANSYASGMVAVNNPGYAYSAETVISAGGFIGSVAGTYNASYSFASGNVTATGVGLSEMSDSQKVGVGGYAGYVNGGTISSSFASGNVQFAATSLKTNATNNLTVGVGGLVGISETAAINNCYASSYVRNDYAGTTADVDAASGTTVINATGGVVGYAAATLTNTYSSGSVSRVFTNLVDVEGKEAAYGDGRLKWWNSIGGVVGYSAAVSGTASNNYFDSWNNSFENLAVVGDGTAISSRYAAANNGGKTTDEFCSGSQVGTLDPNYWGFNRKAYPYLKEFFTNENVSKWIEYPALLSVVAVTPDLRDNSARSGDGLTMYLTLPSYLDVEGTRYGLVWDTTDSDVRVIVKNTADGKVMVPVRTQNLQQTLRAVLSIGSVTPYTIVEGAVILGDADYGKNGDGFSEYGVKEIDRLCADMLGTEAKPYLISTKEDLKHIGLTAYNFDALGAPTGNYGNFYDQWIMPITSSGGFVSGGGKVHFRFMYDVDMTIDVTYTCENHEVSAVHIDMDGDGIAANDNSSMIADLTAVTYNGVAFQGLEIDGFNFFVRNYTGSDALFNVLTAQSNIKNITFENLTLSGAGDMALIKTNNGSVKSVVIADSSNGWTYTPTENTVYNSNDLTTYYTLSGEVYTVATGLVNGAELDENYFERIGSVSSITSTGAKAAGIAVNNSGDISDCLIDMSVTGVTGAGGIVYHNTNLASPVYSLTANSTYTSADGTVYYTKLGNQYTVVSGLTNGSTLSFALTADATYNSGSGKTYFTRSASAPYTYTAQTLAQGASLTGLYESTYYERFGGITRCVFASDVTTETGEVAAIAGNNAGTIDNSFALGSVTATGNADVNGVGGFTGINSGIIDNCYTRASVIGKYISAMNISGFTGTNVATGVITDSFSAGNLTIINLENAVDYPNLSGSAFCGTNSNVNGIIGSCVDKALAGSETYMLVGYADVTEDILDMSCFNSSTGYTSGAGTYSYPQLSGILALPTGTNDPSGNALLKLYSAVSVATIDTRYGQYVDTIPENGIASVSNVAGVTMTATGSVTAAGATAGTGAGSLTATSAMAINGIAPTLTIDVNVGGQNPNFADPSIGSQADPYVIGHNLTYNATGSFAALAYYGNSADACYIIGEDIDFADAAITYPIEYIRGTLNGNEYNVRNTIINNNYGLFGEIDGTVQNLVVSGVTVSKSFTTDSGEISYYGILAGSIIGGEVSNCVVNGSLNVTGAVSRTVYAGGLAGFTESSAVSDIITSGKIVCRPNNTTIPSSIGGVFGVVHGGTTTQDIMSTAFVNGANAASVGGIAGTADSTNITNLVYAGQAVNADGNLVAVNSSSTLTNGYVDYQLATISPAVGSGANVSNADSFMKSTYQLSNLAIAGWSAGGGTQYPSPCSFSFTNSAGSENAYEVSLIPVKFVYGYGTGTVKLYDRIVAPNVTSNSAVITFTAGDGNTYLDVTPINSTGSAIVPKSVTGITAGVTSLLAEEATTTGAIRYFEPDRVRVVTVKYTLTDSTTGAVVRAAGDYLGIMLKVPYSTAFIDGLTSAGLLTTVNGSTGYEFASFVLPVGGTAGFYVEGKLPEDYPNSYKYNLSTTTGSIIGNYVDVSGYTADNNIEINISITANAKLWGVETYYDSLTHSF